MNEQCARDSIVAAANAEIGRDRDPDVYWCAIMPDVHTFPKHWCGAFALWCWKQAGVAEGATWIPGKGFGLSTKDAVKTPAPGDIAYFHIPFQHYAIVEKVIGDTLFTIDGNQIDGKAIVARTRRVKDATVFYSIKRWLPS